MTAAGTATGTAAMTARGWWSMLAAAFASASLLFRAVAPTDSAPAPFALPSFSPALCHVV